MSDNYWPVPGVPADALRIRDVHQSAVSVMLAQLAERDAQLARIGRILDTFYHAEVSASTLQPILDLAVEMNPRKVEP